MTFTSPPFLDPGSAEPGQAPADGFGSKWTALLQAAGAVGTLADGPYGVEQGEPIRAEVRDFPQAMQAAGGWRLSLAAQGVDDLAAMMEPGLAALLAIHTRGADLTVAAQALWEEFAAARAALLTLAPPPRF